MVVCLNLSQLSSRESQRDRGVLRDVEKIVSVRRGFVETFREVVFRRRRRGGIVEFSFEELRLRPASLRVEQEDLQVSIIERD